MLLLTNFKFMNIYNIQKTMIDEIMCENMRYKKYIQYHNF